MRKQHPNKEYIDAFVMGDDLEFSPYPGCDWRKFDVTDEADCHRLLNPEEWPEFSWRIKKKPRVSWMNIYEGWTPTTHATREEADEFHRNHYSTAVVKRFACIKVTEGDGL